MDDVLSSINRSPPDLIGMSLFSFEGIIDRHAGGENVFDSFIMSCRAMGFRLELAFIRSIIDTEPGKRYVGQYLPTERNTPAAELFANAGFENTSDTEWGVGGFWVMRHDASRRRHAVTLSRRGH